MSALSLSYAPRNDDDKKELKRIQNYLLMLNDELKHMFTSMDPEENFTGDALKKYLRNGENIAVLEATAEKLSASLSDAEGNISSLQLTAKSLTSEMADAKGNISVLQQTATSLTSKIADAEGNISTLQQTAKSLTSQISDANGNISALQQTATSLTSRVSDAEGNISSISQTASSLTTRVSNAEGNISTVRQKADRIDWIVSSGSSESSFTLSSRMSSLISDRIDMAGFVTFTSLKTEGKTEINGSNIKTGKIDVDMLYSSGKKVFGTVDGSFVIYQDFVPHSLSLYSLTAAVIPVRDGPTLKGSSGKLNIGKSYDYSTISTSADLSTAITSINRIITWIKSAFV